MTIKKIGAVLLLLACTIYILNPGAGVFELLPDNIPLLGNIDEGLAIFLALCSINYLRTGKFPIMERLKK